MSELKNKCTLKSVTFDFLIEFTWYINKRRLISCTSFSWDYVRQLAIYTA